MTTADNAHLPYSPAAKIGNLEFYYVLMSREEFRLLKLDNMGIDWLPHVGVLVPSGDYLVPVASPNHTKFRPHLVKVD